MIVCEKVQAAVISEFPQCLETFAMVLSFLGWVAGPCFCVSGSFTCSKHLQSQFSLSMFIGRSQACQLFLSLVSESESEHSERPSWDWFKLPNQTIWNQTVTDSRQNFHPCVSLKWKVWLAGLLIYMMMVAMLDVTTWFVIVLTPRCNH